MFLADNELNAELEKIIGYAKNKLILISPFIKLHDRLIASLRVKKNNPKLSVIVIFGKNENDLSKSINNEDIAFFKDFPNIEIRYEKRLHAKYYANEMEGILTSMNLYDFSLNNNIEAGILTKDRNASYYFDRVIEQSQLCYKRIPDFENNFLGLQKKYIGSRITVDTLTETKHSSPPNYTYKKERTGYCIRTGVEIPFNIDKPMSLEAYRIWNEYGNADFPERYCHFTGEPSNGDTNFKAPILKKNWKEAKKYFNF